MLNEKGNRAGGKDRETGLCFGLITETIAKKHPHLQIVFQDLLPSA